MRVMAAMAAMARDVAPGTAVTPPMADPRITRAITAHR